MLKLNLPDCNFRLKKNADDQVLIFDNARKKWIINTPEEWVRQHWIHFFVNEMQVPISQIASENGFKVVQRQKRSDLQIYKNGQIFLLLECKRSTVPIDDSVLKQAINYNKTIQAPYIILSNGLHHFYFAVNIIEGKVSPIQKLPSYENW